MAHASLRTRLRVAAKAAMGLFSDRSAEQACSLLAGLYPAATGALPERGTREILEGYSKMPWLRAVSQRVSQRVAATQWELYIPTDRRRNKSLQRLTGDGSLTRIKAAVEGGVLQPVESHLLLDALRSANDYLVGPSLMRVSQIHVDLVGEAFWIKERNALGAPVGFWPVPPHWVLSTPTPSNRCYKVGFAAWRGDIPDTEIVWFVDPDPANPYGRGSGIARALADELETDEYAARHTKMTFLNRARPDLIIWPKKSETESGTITSDNAQRLAERWTAEHQGFWRAARPYFATRELGVHEVSQSFQDLQLTDLRKQERDIIMQTWGIPPEEMGIVESSNRATADAADHIMDKNVVVPRLEFWRAYFQERVIPEYDERLVVGYVSPLREDRTFQLDAAKAAPWSLTVDEWRGLGGFEPKADGSGSVHMVQSGWTPTPDISVPPAPTPTQMAPTPPLARALPTVRTSYALASGEWSDALAACRDALDGMSTALVERALADDPEVLPGLARRVGRKEGGVRRLLDASLTALRDGVDEEELATAMAIQDDAQRAARVLTLVGVAAWGRDLEPQARGFLTDGFWVGGTFGAEEAGLRIARAPELSAVSFNRVNPEALSWAQARAALLVVQVSDSTVLAIRAIVVEALRLGWGPRKAARLIRETVGLTDRQSAAVAAFAERLLADGVAEAKLLARVAKYADAQRSLRALVIARNELMEAANAGQQRVWELAVQDGALVPDRMVRKWLVAADDRLCDLCEPMDGQTAKLNEPFEDGTFRPPKHVQCRCTVGLVMAASVAEPMAADLAAPVAKALADGLAPLAAAFGSLVARVERLAAGPTDREIHVHLPPQAARTRTIERGPDGFVQRLIDTPSEVRE